MREPTTRGKKPGERGEVDAPFDPMVLAELRAAVGKIVGKPRASRALMAELLDVAPASIFNWENGTPPTRKYRRKLVELKAAVEEGSLGLPDRWSHRDEPPANHPAETPTVLYANDVSVDISDSLAWLRFGVKRPGRSRTTDVCLLVVPPSVMSRLRRR